MSKFVIEPHFRLQEWVAEEKGYFRDEGLDYVFQELIQSTDGQHHAAPGKVGAFQSIERGRASNVTSLSGSRRTSSTSSRPGTTTAPSPSTCASSDERSDSSMSVAAR